MADSANIVMRDEDLSGFEQTIDYNLDGTINYIEATDGANTYRQTFTYSSGQVVGISKWVRQ